MDYTEEEINKYTPMIQAYLNIKKEHVFDAKSRSSRGRTITHASFISLNDGEWNLPKVTDAEFVPLSQLSSENMFEDHYDIIEFFLGNIPNQ